jgi:hypothetical protein
MSAGTATAAFSGLAIVMAIGCNAVIDIADVEFDAPSGTGPTSSTSSGTSGAGGDGTGGSSSTSSSTSTSTATSTGTAAGGSGGAGGSIGPPAENCSNGIDDNGDNLADCEDPLCGHAVCSDLTVPNQWDGPFIFYEGTDKTVTCPGAWPTTHEAGFNGTITAPDATCGVCSCGAVQGASCNATPVTFYTSNNCGGGNQGSQTPNANCSAITDRLFLLDSADAPNTVASGGNCTPAGGAATVVPATSSIVSLLCDQPAMGAGCSTPGESCVERGRSPFHFGLCVARSGNQNCPAGAYSERFDMYTSISDSRDCSNCLCGNPSGVTCTAGQTEIFTPSTNTGCSGAKAQTVVHNNTCYAFNDAGSMRHIAGTAQNGMCAPSGGTPIGSANSLNGRITVCCTP